MWNIKVYGPTILFHMHVSHSFTYYVYLCAVIMDGHGRRDDRSKKSNIEWTVFLFIFKNPNCLLSYVFIDFPSEKGKTLRNGTSEVGHGKKKKSFSLYLTPSSNIHTLFSTVLYIKLKYTAIHFPMNLYFFHYLLLLNFLLNAKHGSRFSFLFFFLLILYKIKKFLMRQKKG